MKSVVLLISVVHLLLLFSSPCTSATTTPNQVLEVVRDIHGDILRSDTRYFVVSPILGSGGGGVRRGQTNECPSQVVQSPQNWDKGTAVYFKPEAAKQVEITESTSLNIEFYNDNVTNCNKNVWEVEGFPEFHFIMFLSTNGEAGNPLKRASWFQIKKVSDIFYKLAFCPFGGLTCTDIGIQDADGQRRLAVNGETIFYFIFIKDTDTGIKSVI